jgi:DNA-directed RNA polymerase sigma subunit (sigma70/sigma32)
MLHDPDRLLLSLDVLERSLEANEQRSRDADSHRADPRPTTARPPYSQIVSEEERPLIVELLTDSVRELDRAGVQVRRHEARALHREGMTMDGIAELFGVSRQRVSALLREPEATTP